MRTMTSLALVMILASACFLGCSKQEPSAEPAGTEEKMESSPMTRQITNAQGLSSGVKAVRTIREMLMLARDGQWEKYIDLYYGETHKFTSDLDREMLVDRFKDDWGFKVVEALEQAAATQPILEGTTARFEVGGETVFILYKDAQGDWKFHL